MAPKASQNPLPEEGSQVVFGICFDSCGLLGLKIAMIALKKAQDLDFDRIWASIWFHFETFFATSRSPSAVTDVRDAVKELRMASYTLISRRPDSL